MEPICIREDVTIPPNDRQSVLTASQLYEVTTVTGILQPSNTLTDDGDIAFCAALVTLTNGQVLVHLNNLTGSLYARKRGTQVANFTFLTPELIKYVKPIDPVKKIRVTRKRDTQVANFTFLTTEHIEYVKPIDPVTTCHIMQYNPENAAYYKIILIKSTKPEDFKENYWFPTPEDLGDPHHRTLI